MDVQDEIRITYMTVMITARDLRDVFTVRPPLVAPGSPPDALAVWRSQRGAPGARRAGEDAERAARGGAEPRRRRRACRPRQHTLDSQLRSYCFVRPDCMLSLISGRVHHQPTHSTADWLATVYREHSILFFLVLWDQRRPPTISLTFLPRSAPVCDIYTAHHELNYCAEAHTIVLSSTCRLSVLQ